MKHHVYLIALKDKHGNITPREFAAPTLAEAIEFLEKDTGLVFAYAIHLI